jgi:hypothetical protein
MPTNEHEMTVVVRDSHIEVDPSLNGQWVRVIILPHEAELAPQKLAQAPGFSRRFGAVAIPQTRITFLSRDEAHSR